MTTKELTEIVTANSQAIAANTASIAELTKNILILHDSVKSLENTALAHDAQIDQLIEDRNRVLEELKELRRDFQAYLTTRTN